ncbi:sensor histidine kinase [Geobacter argillaceus]|uniref:histidine kinase n=1 Tax=Geobacter argillaceus TaxID=345631 RepID=A0A562VPR0_9BACT|nr:ATP-binding protein [Geobacter argillaceus]TWJ19873.1 HAMP domain-containing protein [Geobacter argillaceus]
MSFMQRLSTFRHSFRFRLLLQLALLTAATTAAFTLFYVSHEISVYRSQLQREAQLLADQLAFNAKLPLFAEDRHALTHLIEDAQQRFPVRMLSIANNNGVILATVGYRQVATGDSNDIARSVIVTAGDRGYAPEALLLGKRASDEGQAIGRVSVVLETSGLRTRIRDLVAVSVVIGLCFWLVVSTLGYLLLERVTKSFNLLMQGVKGIERGDLTTRIPVKSNDEPGRAAKAINGLAAGLQRREEENLRLQQERDSALRLEVQEEKKQIMARLIQTNKMTSLGLLASCMSHEINNPNATIGLSAHYLSLAWRDALPLLKRSAEEEGDFSLGGIPFSESEHEIVGCVEKIHANSKRIAQVVQDLRNYSLGMDSEFRSGIDVNVLVASSLTILRCYNRLSESNLSVDTPPELPRITGNQQQLEQVVINLLMNAQQALPKGKGNIRLTTAYDESANQVTIAVTDDGEGIAEEVRSRLLEPFVSTRISDGGSGLGLYISNFIISEHKGCLEFQSEVGKGTTVTIRLPAASPPTSH